MATGWGIHAGQDVEPGTWSECLSMFLGLGGDDALYRGQRSVDWELQCSLERALFSFAKRWRSEDVERMESLVDNPDLIEWARRIEIGFLLHFRQVANQFLLPGLPPAWDRLAWWELMQHHGVPTRLLDWTRSPFTALWFAFDRHEDGDGDVAVWVYDERNARMNLKGIDEPTPDAELVEDRVLQNRLVTKAMEARIMVPVPVQPGFLFSRAVAQQSVLTLITDIPLPRMFTGAVRRDTTTRVRINESWKTEALGACQSMGISRVSLFRDLDSLGSAIAASFEKNERPPRPW